MTAKTVGALQHLTVECQVGHDLLRPTMFVLKLLQALHLGRQQPGILLLPVEVGRRTDPGLAADLRHRCPFLALLDDERLLRVRKLARLYAVPLPFQPGKRSGKHQLQTVQLAGARSMSFAVFGGLGNGGSLSCRR